MFQAWVAVDLIQENAIGHEFDPRHGLEVVVKTHAMADQAPGWGGSLFGHTPRNSTGGDTARLGMADATGHAAAEAQTELG